MNIIDSWVEYPMNDTGKKIAYGILVIITIVLFFAFIFTRKWDYFPFILLTIFASVVIPMLNTPTTYVLAEVTDAPFVEVVSKYELFSVREEEGLYVFKVKSNEGS